MIYYIYIYIYIYTCPPVYHYNSFVATHALGHMNQVHELCPSV